MVHDIQRAGAACHCLQVWLKKGKNVKWIIGSVLVNLPVHDGLKDGGKGRNSDSSPYKNGVLSPVEVAGGTPKWTVYVNLEG